MEKIIGIYMIKNTENNKLYIGQSTFSIQGRFNHHICDLKKNKHSNTHLQRAWNKYRSDMFKFTILQECSKEECNKLEKYWINHYKSNDGNFRYNQTRGGTGNLGHKHSEETKRKISRIKKGKKLSKEHKQKLIEVSRRGKDHYKYIGTTEMYEDAPMLKGTEFIKKHNCSMNIFSRIRKELKENISTKED